MSNIEVGEYVRTPEQGFIGKLVEINEDVLNYYKIDVGREIRRTNGMSDNYIYSRDGFGLKHNKNIIDLIEVGDYVNGEIVTKIKEWNSLIDGHFRYVVTCHYEIIRADEIKSIVTKEQFKEMEYRVDELRRIIC